MPAPGVGSTFHVKLTKVSDPAVSYSFLLEEASGDPAVQVDLSPVEAVSPGQRGSIVIASMHKGAGQLLSRDPLMYEFAEGMLCDKPGEMYQVGLAQVVPTRSWDAQDFTPGAAGGLIAQDIDITITPKTIYNNAAVGLNIANQAESFTGSWARFGSYLFFGVETDGGGASNNVGFYNGISWSFGGFKASYLASTPDKLWTVEWIPAFVVARTTWTDETGTSSPVFASPVDMVLEGYPRGLGILGPHAVVSLLHSSQQRGAVATVSEDQVPLMILSRQSRLGGFTPFLGGQILWQPGGLEAIWLEDVETFHPMRLSFVSRRWSPDSKFPVLQTTRGNPAGFAADATGRTIYYSAYGNWTKRDGTVVAGSVIFQANLEQDGLHGYPIIGPEMFPTLVNAYVMAIDLHHTASGKELRFLTSARNATNALKSDVRHSRLYLGDDGTPPAATDNTVTRFARTSRFIGDHWARKHATVIRGWARSPNTQDDLTVKIYLDGESVNAAHTFTVDAAGPIAQDLPSNIVGRDFALDFQTNFPNVMVEFPWTVDYLAVPNQREQVQLGILIGTEQMVRAGSLQKISRSRSMSNLNNLCATPERWTMRWWDYPQTPDWTVLPLSFQAAASPEATGWLTVQRLA